MHIGVSPAWCTCASSLTVVKTPSQSCQAHKLQEGQNAVRINSPTQDSPSKRKNKQNLASAQPLKAWAWQRQARHAWQFLAGSGGLCGEILSSGEISAALEWPLAETEAQETRNSSDLRQLGLCIAMERSCDTGVVYT